MNRLLTPAQRAKRKAAYEAVHGSAKAIGARAANRAMGRGNATAKLADASFTSDTASKTGTPERSIRRDATRAKALGPDLDRIAGTSLDKGAELDALAAMPASARSEVISRAAAGENVSALRPMSTQEPKPGFAELQRTFKSFRSAWLRASAAGQNASFVESAGAGLIDAGLIVDDRSATAASLAFICA